MKESETNKIELAISEADRFIKKAIAWKIRLRCDKTISGCKEGGAAKRASLDLSRSLADLRR